MIKEITKEWLQEKNACQEVINWFCAQGETDAVKVIEKLIDEGKLTWANWLITRAMTYKQRGLYAIFAAEEVQPIYEKEFPDDKRIRDTIAATKNYVENPTEENKLIARSAAHAADASYAVGYAVARTVIAAYYAADAAECAECAEYAANAAEYAANAADAAYDAYDAIATGDDMLRKILAYGLLLLSEETL